MLGILDTNHEYYCNDANHYSNDDTFEFDGWIDYIKKRNMNPFSGELGEYDVDAAIDNNGSCLFRYDMTDKTLKLYFVLQRKGIFQVAIINGIKEEDLIDINYYLMNAWNYMKNQWLEISMHDKQEES